MERLGFTEADGVFEGGGVKGIGLVGALLEFADRGCGRWVDQTPAAIADAIRELADDPPLRRAMGERAAAFAHERYSWDSIAKTMTGIYSGVH